MLVERAEPGYRFRHALIRDALMQAMPPRVESTALREVAGLAARAAPYALRAADTAGALGAYRDGLNLIDAVRAHAGPADLPKLLARRGDLLLALGDPEAITAAVAVNSGTEHRLVRARLARATGFAGDLDTARAAIAGLSQEGDAADGAILMAQGNLAYFTGDIDAAWDIASQARGLLQTPGDPRHLVDLVALQGLIGGEWFERFRMELRRTQGKQRLVAALFDAHPVCRGVPPIRIGALSRGDRGGRGPASARVARRCPARGGLRTAFIGEAALFMGDLQPAERELLEAVDLHRDVDAPAGEAHSLQRLAEVRLAQGDPLEAQRLLKRALPLARWSVVASHLPQRIYGTMIAAAPDAATARAVVDRAEATMGDTDRCRFCAVMLAVPATIACADVGDIVDARRHLAIAESSAAHREGSAWEAAVCEARAHVARAEGHKDEFAILSARAAQLFHAAGHHRDAVRCELADTTRLLTPRPVP